VQVGTSAASSALTVNGQRSVNGLALTINATRAWSLSISAPRKSKIQWSRDGQSGFSAIDEGQSAVASGTFLATKASTVVVRSADVQSSGPGNDDTPESRAVLLTVVAQ
jgi:hypothetical protein